MSVGEERWDEMHCRQKNEQGVLFGKNEQWIKSIKVNVRRHWLGGVNSEIHQDYHQKQNLGETTKRSRICGQAKIKERLDVL